MNLYTGRKVYRGDIWGLKGTIVRVVEAGGMRTIIVDWEDGTRTEEFPRDIYVASA